MNNKSYKISSLLKLLHNTRLCFWIVILLGRHHTPQKDYIGVYSHTEKNSQMWI